MLHYYMEKKICITCKEKKPVYDFYRIRNRLEADCKVCARRRTGAKPTKYSLKKFRNFSGKIDPKFVHPSPLAPNRRIDLDYEALFKRQGGKCAICKSKGHKKLHVDHDHVTGEIRGLLCFRCNVALGNFRDSPELLQAALAYLLNEKRDIPYLN